MNIAELEHRYDDRAISTKSFLLLPGVNGTIYSDFMNRVFDLCSPIGPTLAVDYPFMHRNERPTDKLVEEQDVLQTAFNYLRAGHPDTTTFLVAKSLGGIVASHWLEHKPHLSNLKIVLFAYDKGDGIKAAPLSGYLELVVQGELDRFGNAEEIREELGSYGVNATVVGIANADHSYRNTQGEPVYQGQAIDALAQYIHRM